jgi:hypothetical protein
MLAFKVKKYSRVRKEMDAEALAFDDIYKHMANFTIKHTKRGYVNGEEHQVLYMVEGFSPVTNEGRWLIKMKGEVSYVSPALYALISDNTHATVIGQTLPDGTMMTRDKTLEIARMRTLGTGSRMQQLQQQLALLPVVTPPQPCTDTPFHGSVKKETPDTTLHPNVKGAATRTRARTPKTPNAKGVTKPTAIKRARSTNIQDAFITATRGSTHVDPPPAPKRQRKIKDLPPLPPVQASADRMCKRDANQLNSLKWATGENQSSVLYSELSEDQRAEMAKQETQVDENYRNVEVSFM